jgi:hypothetical protein
MSPIITRERHMTPEIRKNAYIGHAGDCKSKCPNCNQLNITPFKLFFKFIDRTQVIFSNLEPICEQCYQDIPLDNRPPLTLESITKELSFKKHINHNTKCFCCDVNEITWFNHHCSHILSFTDGGEEVFDNLKPTCISCNLSMGHRELGEFMLNVFGRNINTILRSNNNELVRALVPVPALSPELALKITVSMILKDFTKYENYLIVKTDKKPKKNSTHYITRHDVFEQQKITVGGFFRNKKYLGENKHGGGKDNPTKYGLKDIRYDIDKMGYLKVIKP